MLLRPRQGAGFTAARAAHESLYGLHKCSWRLASSAPGSTPIQADLPPGKHRIEAP
jgi:hypothetical protein